MLEVYKGLKVLIKKYLDHQLKVNAVCRMNFLSLRVQINTEIMHVFMAVQLTALFALILIFLFEFADKETVLEYFYTFLIKRNPRYSKFSLLKSDFETLLGECLSFSLF